MNDELQKEGFISFLKKMFRFLFLSIKFVKNNIGFLLLFLPIALLESYLLDSFEIWPKDWSLFSIVSSITNFFICFIVLPTIIQICIIKYLHCSSSLKELMSDISRQFFPVLKVNLLLFIYIVGGYILFIVPGIILSLRYTFVWYFAICHDQSFSEAKENSANLMMGYKWYYFTFFMLLFIIIFMLLFILRFITVIFTPDLLLPLMYIIGIIASNTISYLLTATTFSMHYLFWKDRLAAFDKKDNLASR